MKRYIPLFLLFISQVALAKWTLATTSPEGDKYYIDLETRKVNGSIVKVWSYIDYPDSIFAIFRESSASTNTEYDCKNAMERDIFLITYKKHHLKGDVINGGEINGKWEPIPPDTASMKMFKLACE